MSETIEALRSEHQNMTRVLDLLENQVVVFEEAGQPDYELIGQIIDYFRRFPDLYHHPKEEVVLARLRERAPDQAERIGDLEGDHEACSDHLQNLARFVVRVLMGQEVSREAFVRLAREFIDNERKHMKGEEAVFFPLAIEVLTAEDWTVIDEKVRRFSDPLDEPDRPYRFDLLSKHIL